MVHVPRRRPTSASSTAACSSPPAPPTRPPPSPPSPCAPPSGSSNGGPTSRLPQRPVSVAGFQALSIAQPTDCGVARVHRRRRSTAPMRRRLEPPGRPPDPGRRRHARGRPRSTRRSVCSTACSRSAPIWPTPSSPCSTTRSTTPRPCSRRSPPMTAPACARCATSWPPPTTSTATSGQSWATRGQSPAGTALDFPEYLGEGLLDHLIPSV